MFNDQQLLLIQIFKCISFLNEYHAIQYVVPIKVLDCSFKNILFQQFSAFVHLKDSSY